MKNQQEARILVVDDEQGIRAGCRRVLESEGYSVDEAENGTDGFAKARAESFDLLLVDMMMPGIGGLDLIRQVHEFDFYEQKHQYTFRLL